MREILGIQYLTDKEASKIYGYSISWFKKRRYDKLPPKFMKLEGKGRTYYSVLELEEWFKKNMISY